MLNKVTVSILMLVAVLTAPASVSAQYVQPAIKGVTTEELIVHSPRRVEAGIADNPAHLAAFLLLTSAGFFYISKKARVRSNVIFE